jgi:hypothetical protein
VDGQHGLAGAATAEGLNRLQADVDVDAGLLALGAVGELAALLGLLDDVIGADDGGAFVPERIHHSAKELLHVRGRARVESVQGKRRVEGVKDDEPAASLAEQLEHVLAGIVAESFTGAQVGEQARDPLVLEVEAAQPFKHVRGAGIVAVNPDHSAITAELVGRNGEQQPGLAGFGLTAEAMALARVEEARDRRRLRRL